MAKEKTKWRWNEYNEWKNKENEPETTEEPVRSGQCDECGFGSFTLRINKGKMDRICKGCGVIKENV